MISKIKEDLTELAALLKNIEISLADQIYEAAEFILHAYRNNGCVYFFGNGGSAADAQHLSTELVCRFKKNRKALPALALTTDSSFMTACANDYDFHTIFERQIEAFVGANDICIGISTSGNSENVLKGFQMAKERGAKTIAFLGSEGGKMKNLTDVALIVPSSNTPRIQECHITIGHIICDIVETELFKND
ncbi:SIS domain-containing protein [bacterium]